MELQNESGRNTLDVVDSNVKEHGSEKRNLLHSSSLRSDDMEGVSQMCNISENMTRQNSISSAVSGTRPDQGRAEDFFDVRFMTLKL